MDDVKRRLVTDPRYRAGIEACLEHPTVLIAPTNFCNFACDYCSTKDVSNKKVNMDLALVESIVDQCVQHGWNFSFGQTYEPFLHPRINAIIAYVHGKGRRFNSPTNALAIHGDAYDLPMNLTISYSATESDYRYRNSKISYVDYRDKVLGFIRYRIDHGVPGVIALQIADYSIFNGDLTYSRSIHEIGPIFEKTVQTMRHLGLATDVDEDAWRQRIAARAPLVLHEAGDTKIQVAPTKILPNTYEAFTEMPEVSERKGYCDSCYTMMSIQADGTVAFCCCDPSAKVVAGSITAETDLQEFWLGEAMSEIRRSFLGYTPKHDFCVQCLHNVTENTKPLLTVRNPALVAEILTDYGISGNLPWFTFPK
ncbi:Radical SAM superfamily enzyme, MoaA/NifB/PqqE/SkfB family [Paucidesulfovibrio gracilis DSM 16080]|uniref:Radical SAM superfamily enzyme, MoaA/NifB/PqqE/SkfB family n=1 Tax=Paucidesulfovibrio gracilis DSM 16080 TaxID=1121449 RepID=A0A1T4W958_9BACT|nr:radical SAM/SPASM domain-containing protein [Paucidesulfovibrio gracilis]SKA73810.1 Radical SAM superfamily enzyme, MoaA/NifB/PqqE/SkfB family [Paucidesulfovibrio gracilis DSM 16080]